MASGNGQRARTATEPPEGDGTPPLVLVDGSNVAHASEGEALLDNIRVVCAKLREEGYEPVVVAGSIKQAPAGTDADYFILSFARELDASIVSNDRFRDRQKAFPDAAKRLIRYMVVKGEVVFERRTERRED
jgi:hypothetical protein